MGLRIGLAAAVVAVGFALPAEAGRVPTPVLTATGGTQQGDPVATSESGRSGKDVCWGMISDGDADGPDAIRHDAAKGLEIRLARADRPLSVSVEIQRGPVQLPVATNGTSTYTLRPVKTRGRTTGWDVVLPPPGAGDLYLTLRAEWRGECGNDDGTWRFHVLAL